MRWPGVPGDGGHMTDVPISDRTKLSNTSPSSKYVQAAGALALVISTRLQQIISQPIAHLVETTRSISERRDYQARATKLGDDEVGTLVDAFNEIDLAKHRAVEKAADALDWEAFTVLATSSTPNGFPHPALGTMGQVLGNVQKYSALERLLSMGAIETEYPRITLAQVKETPDAQLNVVYRATSFGQALMTVVATRMGGDDPQLMQHAAVLFDSD